MDLHGGFVHLAQHQVIDGLQAALNALFNRIALFGAGFFQHPVHHFGFVSGVTDADAQPPVVGAAQLAVDVAQPVVACVAAAQLELGFASRQIQLVVGHQNFLGRNLEKPCQAGYRLARFVHEGLGLQQPDGLALYRGAGHQSEIAALQLQAHAQLTRQTIYPPETGVVACVFVIRARIAQAHQQFDHAFLQQKSPLWAGFSARC